MRKETISRKRTEKHLWIVTTRTIDNLLELDPKVTISDNLVIDVDGIIDNDDEVSLETPVTIPDDIET